MIPYKFHFVNLTPSDPSRGKSFGYAHYLCLLSIIKHHPDASFHFYYNKESDSPWLELLRPFLSFEYVDPPKEIFGQKIKKVEHQADIVRLEKLIEFGGIYVDTDVFFLKPLDDLLEKLLVMGIENGMGLCNAVIMAEQQAPFLREWLQSYHPDSTRKGAGFDPNGWGEMSVRFPEYLAEEFKDEVTVLPSWAFYQPSGSERGLEILFDSLEYSCPDSYANHLWASQAWEGYLKNLTPEKVLGSPGYFYDLVRKTMTEEEIKGEFNLVLSN